MLASHIHVTYTTVVSPCFTEVLLQVRHWLALDDLDLNIADDASIRQISGFVCLALLLSTTHSVSSLPNSGEEK